MTRSNVGYNCLTWKNAAGNGSLELNGGQGGAIAQTFPTVAGGEYLVAFMMAGNMACGQDPRTMRVSAAGQSAGFSFYAGGHSYSDMGWEPRNWRFRATGPETTIEIESLMEGACGPAIDEVSLTSLKPPIKPPAQLTCMAEPGRRAVLRWTNGETYDHCEVFRDGTAPQNLLSASVEGEAYADEGAEPGSHKYYVRGVLGLDRSALTGPCTVDVPEETDFFLRLGNLSGEAGREVDLLVTLDFDHLASDPPIGAVEAWEYGICSDPELVEPLAVSIAGTDTGSLNGGAGPEFRALKLHGTGVTVAVVVDLELEESVPPVNGWKDVMIRYRLVGNDMDCFRDPSGATGLLRVCDTLGDPVVSSVAAMSQRRIPASGFDGGDVRVECPGHFFIRLGDGDGPKYSEVSVNVILDFDHAGGGPGPVQGWSYGVCHDRRVLRLALPSSMEATLGTDLSSWSDGAGPEFFNLKAYDGGVTVAVILDAENRVLLPPRNGWHDVSLTYYLLAEDLDCLARPEVVTSEIGVCSNLGTPPVGNVMTVGFRSIPLGGHSRGKVTVRCGTLFRRGDANQDGRYNISDAIALFGYLFGALASTCLDSLDADDSGIVDITDPIYLLHYLFLGGPAVLSPFPGLGLDQSPDVLSCESWGA